MDKYYIAEFRSNNTNYYMLWQDERFLTGDGGPAIFSTIGEAKEFISSNNLEADESVTSYDLDQVTDLITKTEISENCRTILDCWNIFSDLSATTGEEFLGDDDIDENEHLFSKLVMGCNLPEINNEEFHPVLDELEQNHLKIVLSNGRLIFLKIVAGI